ncbi:GNAT family N-acetyltransferase [Halobacillus karajensis]|uniref:Spermidine N(1)-acetyltransferase n=2 Tax=Halobacillus karajensis TaxID=195088 RepID=A0A024P336_9BACI|nr:GNAT family protein [Halobacillus karajensis]CDQ19978.1 Spermidine N(1)-acetyltransferase [Halobacillus karajensis]CDQ22438.1 Spermidine N(1)-acetyltransferase [Halobacillus karajensis]CDQ28281.1 Spermidine N(1)-acetyltransferase [Halobacillus karajensis]
MQQLNPSTPIQGTRVTLRPITEEDIPVLYKLIYNGEDPDWKKWDAPYYPLEPHTLESYRSHETARKNRLGTHEPDSRLIIDVNGTTIGTVTYYWEHKSSLWLEVGIGIYDPDYWNGGYGFEALELWIDHLFQTLPLARVGLTTWSKNQRMIRVGEKLGMKLEGRLRKCRLFEGHFYDSIRMGVLREEWMKRME